MNLDVAKEDTVPGYRFGVVDGAGLLAADFEEFLWTLSGASATSCDAPCRQVKEVTNL